MWRMLILTIFSNDKCPVIFFVSFFPLSVYDWPPSLLCVKKICCCFLINHMDFESLVCPFFWVHLDGERVCARDFPLNII